jgi:parvulin-like peptidyl-prolyl isomerase
MFTPPPGLEATMTSPAEPPLKATPRRFAAVAAVLSRRPGRSLALGVIAAIAGLAIAAAGLFRPAPSAVATVPPGDVALVNQEPILMSDFMSETEQKYGVPFAQTTPAQRAQQLRDMIDQELLVQRSLALDLPEQDTNSRSALQDGVTALVDAPVVAERPNDEVLKAFYAAHRANYATHGSMTLTDLVLHVGGFENADQTVEQAMADAAEAAYQLRSGASLDAVKRHFGLVDSGKVAGAEPDFAARLHLGAKLYDVAQGMSDGTISPPIADSDGVHLLIMQQRIAPVFNDFEGVRNNVYADYQAAQKAKANAANLKFLRASAQILLAPGQAE